MPSQLEWDHRFLQLAELVASWSKDPSTKTGAVFVDEDKRIISVGYNGLARGIKDDERLNDREWKYNNIIHCERNALIFAKRSLRNSTLYTWPFLSCDVCAAMMIQAGIKRHVSIHSNHPRFGESVQGSINMFKEAGVEVCLL